MRAVDHDLVRCAVLTGERGEDLVKHPKPAPAHEAVVKRLVWTIGEGASLQRKPLRITYTIPLTTRWSSTRGMPCGNGKCLEIRSICSEVSRTCRSSQPPPKKD
jgi:hypothetical protein